METQNQERNEQEWKQIQERIKQVERELLDKNRHWPQAKANFLAKKLLCLIN